jgi:hypothetical protein
LSRNLFVTLAAGSYWDLVPALQLLYLDENAITSVPSLAALAAHPALLGIEKKKKYRKMKSAVRGVVSTESGGGEGVV